MGKAHAESKFGEFCFSFMAKVSGQIYLVKSNRDDLAANIRPVNLASPPAPRI